jgi:hypothetical protein
MLDEGGRRAEHPRYLVAAVVTECSAQGKRRRAAFNVGLTPAITSLVDASSRGKRHPGSSSSSSASVGVVVSALPRGRRRLRTRATPGGLPRSRR